VPELKGKPMTRSLSVCEQAPAWPPLWRGIARLGVVLLGCASLAACSLLSIKSPERPLPARELNARLLTRQFSADFVASVESCADDIAAAHPGTPIERAALRWKLIATSQSERAALQLAPLMALLDNYGLQLIPDSSTKIFRITTKDPMAPPPRSSSMAFWKPSLRSNISRPARPRKRRTCSSI